MGTTGIKNNLSFILTENAPIYLKEIRWKIQAKN